MPDAIADLKTQAITIARMANVEQSYVVDGFWTDGCCAIRVAEEAPPTGLVLECSCGESGCGCQCEVCLTSCEQGETACPELSTCPHFDVWWGRDRSGRLDQVCTVLPALLQSVAVAECHDASIGRKIKPDWHRPLPQRCVLLAPDQHVAHANTRYLATVRRVAQPTLWRFTRQSGPTSDSPLLIGYRGDELVALLAPLSGGAACDLRPS